MGRGEAVVTLLGDMRLVDQIFQGRYGLGQSGETFLTDVQGRFLTPPFTAFDFLIAAFLNIGNFGGKKSLDCRHEPEFYTFPVSFIQEHHDKSSSWEKVRLRNLDIDQYKDAKGFELIAEALGIPYPARAELAAIESAPQI